MYTKTPGNGLLCLEMKMNKCTTSFGKLLGGAGVKQFKQAGKLKSGVTLQVSPQAPQVVCASQSACSISLCVLLCTFDSNSTCGMGLR